MLTQHASANKSVAFLLLLSTGVELEYSALHQAKWLLGQNDWAGVGSPQNLQRLDMFYYIDVSKCVLFQPPEQTFLPIKA